MTFFLSLLRGISDHSILHVSPHDMSDRSESERGSSSGSKFADVFSSSDKSSVIGDFVGTVVVAVVSTSFIIVVSHISC